MRDSFTVEKLDDGTFSYRVCKYDKKKKKEEYMDYKPYEGTAKTLDEAIKKAEKILSSQKGFKEYVE